MIIVIDGYNVLKQILPRIKIEVQQRTSFIKLLARYAVIKGHQLVIVFDGGVMNRPEIATINGTQVIYVGINMTADDYIGSYLAQRVGHDVLLVSTDRALNRRAHALKIPSIDSDDFYRMVMLACNPHTLSSGESPLIILQADEYRTSSIDDLMRQAAAQIAPKKIDLVTHEVDSMHGLKKIDKLLLKKLKKL